MNINPFNIKIESQDNITYNITFIKDNTDYKLILERDKENTYLSFINAKAYKQKEEIKAEILNYNDECRKVFIEDCNLQFNIFRLRSKDFSICAAPFIGKIGKNNSYNGPLYSLIDQSSYEQL